MTSNSAAFRDSKLLSHLVGVVGAVLLVVGCSQPVEYSADATPEAEQEAPAFDSGAVTPEGEAPTDDGVTTDVAAPADSSDATEPPAALPWQPAPEDAAEAPPSEEAQRFFGGLPAADEATSADAEVGDRYAQDASAEPNDSDGDSYLEFLEKQLGVTGDTDPPPPEPAVEDVADTTPPPPAPAVAAEVAPPIESEPLDQIDLPAPDNAAPDNSVVVIDDPPVVSPPASQPANDSLDGFKLDIGTLDPPRRRPRQSQEPSAPPQVAETTPAPSQPPADYPFGEPLVATTDQAASPAPTVEDLPPPPEPVVTEPATTKPEPSTLVAPESPAADTPREPVLAGSTEDAATENASTGKEPATAAPIASEPSTPDPFDDPASRQAAVDTLPTEPATEPAPTPSVEPKPKASMASVEPLPAVPVLPYNTRHLAWLLGGKLGLAQLAGVEGATPAEVGAWTDEASRLARQLDLGEPAPAAPSGSAERRLKELLKLAAVLGDRVAQKHGRDHAALVEISLKTNALLVLFDDHPELAGPVARSVTSAAERAMLPGRLWRDATRRLEFAESSDELYDAVTQLHADVEAYLR